MGDYNCVCNSVDKSGPDMYIDRSARPLEELLEQCDLLEVGKHTSRGEQLKYTWFHASSHAWLDRIYLSITLAKDISTYDVEPVFFR